MRRLLVAPALLLSLGRPALAEPSAACVRGLEAEAAGSDIASAHFWLEDCLESNPDDEVRVSAKKALRRITARLRAGSFAEVAFISEPEGATLAIAALGLRFTAPRTLWLPFGAHQVAAELDGFEVMTQTVEIHESDRVTVVATLRKKRKAGTGDGSVDFSADPPPVSTSRNQQAEEFDSLLPARFGSGGGQPGGDDDRARAPRWPVWASGIGLVVAGGAFAAYLTDHDNLAIGLTIGSGAMLATGATGLVVTRW